MKKLVSILLIGFMFVIGFTSISKDNTKDPSATEKSFCVEKSVITASSDAVIFNSEKSELNCNEILYAVNDVSKAENSIVKNTAMNRCNRKPVFINKNYSKNHINFAGISNSHKAKVCQGYRTRSTDRLVSYNIA